MSCARAACPKAPSRDRRCRHGSRPPAQPGCCRSFCSPSSVADSISCRTSLAQAASAGWYPRVANAFALVSFRPSSTTEAAMSFHKLDDLGHKLEALEHALAILGADEATHMAVGGGEKRAEAMAALAGMYHTRAT